MAENEAAVQFPDIDSMPDGFVDGSTGESFLWSKRLKVEKRTADSVEEKEGEVADYKEEKLMELEFEDDLVAGIRMRGRTSEKNKRTRTFPVQLRESDDSDKLTMTAENEACFDEGTSRLIVLGDEDKVSSHLLPETPRLEIVAQESCQVLGNEDRGGNAGELMLVTNEQNVNAESHKKAEISEVKRNNTMYSLKSEIEFVDFSLRYQQALAERDGAIIVRDNLEVFCRDLQSQNKMLMNECRKVSTDGLNLRMDLSNRFQNAVKEMNTKLEEQKDNCLSQLKENEMLKEKLKQLTDQQEHSELQYSEKLKQKSIELQIADLKIQQHEGQLIQERSQLKLYAEQVSQLLETEKNLRSQIKADGEKFQKFQETLVKSNETFETFKQEIEMMKKSINGLKVENAYLKSKCEKADYTIVQLIEARHDHMKQMEKTLNQKQVLESLCRTLQQGKSNQDLVEPKPESKPNSKAP